MHRTPLELELLPEDCQTMSDCLLDLRFECGMPLKKLVVLFCTQLCMIIHVGHLFASIVPSSHQSRGTRSELRKLIEMVTNVLALVKHIHHLLNFAEFRGDGWFSEVR